ncbi:hypothetical protein HBI12_076960 [Parastagonospora nodorum]|nr:hypothetical protein HBI12_076960 [Parastagonospora nodorum]
MILLQDMHQKSQGLKSPAVLKTVSAYAAPPPPPLFPPPPFFFWGPPPSFPPPPIRPPPPPPLFRPDYCVIEAAAAAITHSLELQ